MSQQAIQNSQKNFLAIALLHSAHHLSYDIPQSGIIDIYQNLRQIEKKMYIPDTRSSSQSFTKRSFTL